MSENIAAGVDLGGTNLRVAISDSSGDFLDVTEEEINTSSEYSISTQIVNGIRSLCKKTSIEVKDLEGIGIASTGPMDIEKGILIQPSNLPFEKIPLVKPVEKELGIPTYLINDCTAGALGEKIFGEGREKEIENIVYVNIGTGIGGGAIVNNQLLLGKDGNAVEIGHMTIDPEGRLECGCGKKGHWEAYCSGKNIPKFIEMELEKMDKKNIQESSLSKYVNNGKDITTKLFYKIVKSGDNLAKQLADKVNELNSIGFGNIVDVYDPTLITVGGSVALKNEKQVIAPLKDKITARIRNKKPKIIATPLRDEIGLYGSLAQVFQEK